MDRNRFRISPERSARMRAAQPLPKSAEHVAPVWQQKPSIPIKPQPNTASKPPTAKEPAGVSIQINLPQIRLPKLKIADAKQYVWPHLQIANQKLRQNRNYFIAGASVLVLVVSTFAGGAYIKRSADARKAAKAAAAVTQKAKAVKTKPEFEPVTSGAAAEPAKSAYDSTKGVYSFADKVAGKDVIVSQQPVPEQFKSAFDAVNDIAESLKAGQSTAINGGTAYIATDEQAGAQTVVFSKNNLLIFIQSPFKHSQAQWQAYINSLKD